jgi:anti-sigma-K factor RskA
MTSSEASSADDRLLVRYLLGHLSDAQAERFDRSSIEDDDFADRLRLIEQELVDGYVRRTLPAELMASVERHYAASPRRLHRSKMPKPFSMRSTAQRHKPKRAWRPRSILARRAATRRRTFTRLLALAAAIVVAISAAVVVSRGAFGSRRSGRRCEPPTALPLRIP